MKKEKLTSEDFRYKTALRYYSFEDPDLGIEIAIEPCFNGFDVALYLIANSDLIRPKECTDEQDYGTQEFIRKEIQVASPQIRKLETWIKALSIANRFYIGVKNYVKARKMNILELSDGEEESVFKKIIDNQPIHGINPRGKI